MIVYEVFNKRLIIQLLMRPLSPIRSTSPLNKPKITFNYPPSPLRERPSTSNAPLSPLASPKAAQGPVIPPGSPGSVAFWAQKCKSCQKQATYKGVGDGSRYCSNCAIIQMRSGANLARIQLKDQPFYKNYHLKAGKQNYVNHTERTASMRDLYAEGRLSEPKEEHQQIDRLFRQAQTLKEDLQTLMAKLQDKEFASEGIKAIYKEKKLGLKSHYQKIKASIKISIEKDLAELQKRQRLSLECLQDIKTDINSGLYSLQKIAANLDSAHTHYNPTQMQDKLEESASIVSCMKDKKQTAAQIVDQLAAFEHGREANSDSLHVRLTQEQIEDPKNELYDSSVYTLLCGRGKKSQTFFSFERRANP